MKFEFDLLESDLQQFYAFFYWHSPDKKSFRLKRRLSHGAIMLSIFALFFFFIAKTSNGMFTATIIWFTVMGGVMFALGFYRAETNFLSSVAKNLKAMLKEGKNKNLLGHQVIELTDTKIIAQSQDTDTSISVTAIERITEDNNAYYIYVSSIQALIIPKRALTPQNTTDLKNWISNQKQ